MVIPVPLTAKPFEVIPITQRAQNLTVFDANYTTPYVQTFTLGLTRSLTSKLTMDVKYVGTRGTKLTGSVALNDADVRNNGLLKALEITRAGGDAPLFDTMLKGVNLGSGVVGQAISGSEALRRNATFRAGIANGDFVAVARTLSSTNVGTTQPPLTNAGLLRSSGAFPPNFIVANPQFNEITWRTNADNSNYQSLQAQLNVRQIHGFNYQATYLWSRSLGVTSTLATTAQGSGFRDLQNQRADYTRLPSDRTHDFRSYGTFDLPFGPNKLLGGKTSGWAARLIEGWKLGTILSLTAGQPLNVVGRNTLYSNGTPEIVGAFPRKGEVVWPQNPGDIFGNFFGQQYKNVQDPGCAAVASTLTAFCTNTALADANGNIVLRNAASGQLGTLGLRTIEGPGSWSFDANLQKSVRVAEAKNLTLRVDATNVFNHPTPGNPNLNINTGTFGQINMKTGSRLLQAQLRFDF
ncbi:MAG: hypothetical protein DMG14_31115 [Acidobacteria bacterium]|nr:MAG: hypothetical protein DMG14_31115 [Acidobacteriota bacterium]